MVDEYISIIIAGSFTVLGAIISSVASWLTSRNNKRIHKLEKYVTQLGDQVKSYWRLERLYAHKLAELERCNEETILRKNRTYIAEQMGVRPKMTANDVDKLLNDIRL